ncbi:MAG: hypothetical protein GXP29_13420 [Planctomycetes bacterium]|nr:hypothetical protein [Planctomycetota bacterium]
MGIVDLGFHHPFPDCNTNGVFDFEDIAGGSSADCGALGNGIPDECEPDCDTNGVVDTCEIQSGLQSDCDFDLVPDNCVEFIDCDANGTFDACDILNGVHSDCDVNGVPDLCQPDCDNDSTPDSCELTPIGNSGDCNSNGVPDECDIAGALSLDCDANGVPDECQPDCNSNGIADRCDIVSALESDCNSNGIPDRCDIEGGSSFDADANGEPDECGIDCNMNGVADLFDIAGTTSTDCDGNEIPDDCEVDCNVNGVADVCDISDFVSLDCDVNGVPDECDIASGSAEDCNSNGSPDDCELLGGAFLNVLLNPNPEAQFSYSTSLAIERDRFLIGSAGDSSFLDGAGLVFLHDSETGDLVHTFASPAPAEGEAFGAAVAFIENRIWIGAPGAGGTFDKEGVVYIFDASTYGFEDVITNPTPGENDQFGGDVIGVAGKAAVGARLDDTAANNAGAVYVFSAADGVLTQSIPDPAGQSSDLFGSGLAEAGGWLVVGVPRDDRQASNSGVVHIINIDSGDVLRTVLNPSPAANDSFGASVAGLSNKIVIGAPLDDTDGPNVGSAYLADAATGAILWTVAKPNPVDGDQLGLNVGAAGGRAIVGATLGDTGATNAGSLIVVDAASGTLVGALENPSPEADDNFTSSLAGHGDQLLIGAWRDDTVGENAGAVYHVQLGFDENTNGVPDSCDICGDMDGDEDVDDADLSRFLAAFAQSAGDVGYLLLADLDHDDVVTLVDYQLWLACYRDFLNAGIGVQLGDFDGDGDVDSSDYIAWLDCERGPGVSPAPTTPTTIEQCLAVFDSDEDGDLDLADFNAIQTAGIAESGTIP